MRHVHASCGATALQLRSEITEQQRLLTENHKRLDQLACANSEYEKVVQGKDAEVREARSKLAAVKAELLTAKSAALDQVRCHA